MSPAGGYGPSFLVLENYKVIRRYNTSDLYAVFVGNLADRIAGGGDFETPWGGVARAEDAHHRRRSRSGSRRTGYEVEKIDGKVGSNTRKVIGSLPASQQAQGRLLADGRRSCTHARHGLPLSPCAACPPRSRIASWMLRRPVSSLRRLSEQTRF